MSAINAGKLIDQNSVWHRSRG